MATSKQGSVELGKWGISGACQHSFLQKKKKSPPQSRWMGPLKQKSHKQTPAPVAGFTSQTGHFSTICDAVILLHCGLVQNPQYLSFSHTQAFFVTYISANIQLPSGQNQLFYRFAQAEYLYIRYNMHQPHPLPTQTMGYIQQLS